MNEDGIAFDIMLQALRKIASPTYLGEMREEASELARKALEEIGEDWGLPE